MMILVMIRIHQDNDNVLLMSHALVSELDPDTTMTDTLHCLMTYLVTDMSR